MEEEKIFRTSDLRVRIEPTKLDELLAAFPGWKKSDIVHHLIDEYLGVSKPNQKRVSKENAFGFSHVIWGVLEANYGSFMRDSENFFLWIIDFKRWANSWQHTYCIQERINAGLHTRIFVTFHKDYTQSDAQRACDLICDRVERDILVSRYEAGSFLIRGSHDPEVRNPRHMVIVSDDHCVFSDIFPGFLHGYVFNKLEDDEAFNVQWVYAEAFRLMRERNHTLDPESDTVDLVGEYLKRPSENKLLSRLSDQSNETAD